MVDGCHLAAHGMTEASTTSFGQVSVTLWRRSERSDASCAEVLVVTVHPSFSDDDVSAYIKFHNAFVLHRAKKEWPHRFGLVYDVRALRQESSKVFARTESVAAFALMHSSLGDAYKRWLHRVVAVIPSADVVDRLRQLQAPFVDAETKPVVFVTDVGAVGEAMMAA